MRNFLIIYDFPDARREALWRDFLNHVELPEHYNAPEFFLEPWWVDKRPFAVLAMDSGNVVGVITGIHQNNEVQCGLPARPQICFDKTRDGAMITDLLAEGLLAEAGSTKLVNVYSWSPLPALQRYDFGVRQMEGNVVLDLTLGSDALMKQFHPSRRRNIRFAIKQDLEVSQAHDRKDFEDCYDLYCRWRQNHRKKISGERLPFSMLEEAWSLAKNRRLFMVRLNGKIIATDTVRFHPRGLLQAAANCSLHDFLNHKPNDLVMWRIIEWACQEGFTRFSLDGAHSFLRYFGGTVLPIYRYRLDRTFLRSHQLQDSILDIGRRGLAAARWSRGLPTALWHRAVAPARKSSAASAEGRSPASRPLGKAIKN